MSDNISTLREALFATLRAVKSGEMDLDRARMVNEVGKTLIETARVEVDFIRQTGGGDSTFIAGDPPKGDPAPKGITTTTVHRLR